MTSLVMMAIGGATSAAHAAKMSRGSCPSTPSQDQRSASTSPKTTSVPSMIDGPFFAALIAGLFLGQMKS